MTMPKEQKPKQFKVWVPASVARDLQRFGNLFLHRKRDGMKSRVPATLTLTDKPKPAKRKTR